MKTFIIAALLLPLASAQITIKLTPEPMVVPASQLSNAKDLGRWVVQGCNDGSVPATLTVERLSIFAPNIRFIDDADAALVLNNHAQHGPWNVLQRVTNIGSPISAFALEHFGAVSPAMAIGIGMLGQFLPILKNLSETNSETAAPLLVTMQWPVTLQPGACFTDHKFAAKMRNPVPVVLSIPVNGPPLPSPLVPKTFYAPAAISPASDFWHGLADEGQFSLPKDWLL